MGSDLAAIKKRIYEKDHVEDILEELRCGHIRKSGELWLASLPDGDNDRSIQVKDNERLTTNIRTRRISGDIFTLVIYIKKKVNTESDIHHHLPWARKWVCELLGYYDFLDGSYQPPKVHNGWLKALKKKRVKHVDLDEIKHNSVLDEATIKRKYKMHPHKKWTDEGIWGVTQYVFETGYDEESNRIINLIRNKDGELIGVKGRTLVPDEEAEERGIPKYLYLHKFDKSLELYNLHRAMPYIQEAKRVYVFEGYKSVMKCSQYGDKNCVSIEGDKMSDVQAALLKQLGVDVEIVFCLDKDKKPKEVLPIAQQITNRKVYAVFDLDVVSVGDEDGLLGKKDSPVDKGLDAWRTLVGRMIEVPQKKVS